MWRSRLSTTVMLNEVKHLSGPVAGRSFTSFRMTIGRGLVGKGSGATARGRPRLSTTVMLNEVKHLSGPAAGRSFTSYRMTIGRGGGGQPSWIGGEEPGKNLLSLFIHLICFDEPGDFSPDVFTQSNILARGPEQHGQATLAEWGLLAPVKGQFPPRLYAPLSTIPPIFLSPFPSS